MFTELVDQCAHIHRIEINCFGQRRTMVAPCIRVLRKVAIGGQRSDYRWLVDALHADTSASVKLKHGKKGTITNIKRVADTRLLLKSTERPLTLADTLTSTFGLMKRRTVRAIPSLVELSCDISGVSVDSLTACSLSPAQFKLIVDGFTDDKTGYFGSVQSAWQARIYVKAANVTRVEWVLRSSFLRQHGVDSIEDVLKLRRLPIAELLALKAVTLERVTQMANTKRTEFERRLVRYFAKFPREYPHVLPEFHDIAPKSLFIEHPLSLRLKRMLAMLFW